MQNEMQNAASNPHRLLGTKKAGLALPRNFRCTPSAEAYFPIDYWGTIKVNCAAGLLRVPAISERLFFMNQQYSYIIEEIRSRRNKKSPRRHKANGGKRKENMNTI